MATEKGANGEVVKLAAIIGLQSQDRTLKLSVNIGVESSEDTNHIRLVSKRKCPYIVRTAINDN